MRGKYRSRIKEFRLVYDFYSEADSRCRIENERLVKKNQRASTYSLYFTICLKNYEVLPKWIIVHKITCVHIQNKCSFTVSVLHDCMKNYMQQGVSSTTCVCIALIKVILFKTLSHFSKYLQKCKKSTISITIKRSISGSVKIYITKNLHNR